MKKRITLWKEGEYNFPGSGKFVPFMMANLHKDDHARPAMIVAPGGGFIVLQPAEADGIAQKFYDMGYNTFVLVYTNNVTLDKPSGRQAIQDASRAVKMIRKNCREWGVDPDRIAAFGSSGGGYIVAALATLHDQPEMAADDEYNGISNRINAAILNYARIVLTTEGKNARTGSHLRLLGEEATASEIEAFSLEKRVSKTSVPMFMLHGTHDLMVHPMDVQMMAAACQKNDVPYETHIFCGRNHGFSVTGLPAEYVASSFYVYEQLYETVMAMRADQFARYGNILGDLRQDMGYDEFMQTVQEKTMMRLWEVGLNRPMDVLMTEMTNAMTKSPYLAKPYENTNYCFEMVHHWVNLLWS